MATEAPLLQETDVRAAENLEDEYANHPVILTLNRLTKDITRFNKGYFSLSIDKRDNYLKKSSAFLVKALLEAAPYDLEPLSLVAIWSKVFALFPDKEPDQSWQPPYHRHSFAGIVSSVYAIQDIKEKRWKKFPYYFLTHLPLPKYCYQDTRSAIEVSKRVMTVQDNVEEVGYYTWGTRRSIGDLINRILEGDQEARKELEPLKKVNKERDTIVLGELRENFVNGITYGVNFRTRLRMRGII